MLALALAVSSMRLVTIVIVVAWPIRRRHLMAFALDVTVVKTAKATTVHHLDAVSSPSTEPTITSRAGYRCSIRALRSMLLRRIRKPARVRSPRITRASTLMHSLNTPCWNWLATRPDGW
jgi:hypothetical protein